MKDILNIAVVNFEAIWGDKEANLKRIVEFSDAAGRRGAHMVVFPETALSGYSDDPCEDRSQKMHVRLAETIPGPATDAVAEVAKKHDLYVLFGMPEKDAEGTVFNSAAIVCPDGSAKTYRKIHLPFDEANWAERGDYPAPFDTPWGPVGVSICYDSYCFPELVRYYRAKGARLVVNCTANPSLPCTKGAATMTIPTYAYINYVFIASSNLVGTEPSGTTFIGGSSVVGPDVTHGGTYTYVGKMFSEPESDRPEMFLGTIDLATADMNTDIPLFRINDQTGSCDWRPDLYRKMHAEFE